MEAKLVLGIIKLVTWLLGKTAPPKADQDLGRMHPWAQTTAKHWRTRRRKVEVQPRPAHYLGRELRPLHAFLRVTPGALGIADRKLIFVPHRSRHEQVIPLNTMRWIGTRSLIDDLGRADTLVVHYEVNKHWYIGAWVVEEPKTIAEVLGQLTRQPYHEYMNLREDYGPAEATCVQQDVYGQWLPSAKLKSATGTLYLVPGCLLFDGHPLINLDSLRRIEVLKHGGAQDLLRLEYGPPGEVVGFLLHEGEQWAALLSRYAAVPYEMGEGRKKKEDD